jgi:transcription-repair coupling factor (superfamily II helicase)
MYNLLLNLFEHATEYQSLRQSVQEDISPILIHGADPEALKWVLLRLSQETGRRIFILFEDDMRAKSAAEAIDEAVYLPSKEIVWFDSYAHSAQIEHERVEALLQLEEDQGKLLFTSVNNIACKYPPKEAWLNQAFTFDMAHPVEHEVLKKCLLDFGYERVDMVDEKGQYSLRGGILDIFSPMYETPHRIEFFDDGIDSIRSFDVETQKSLEKRTQLKIYPCREIRVDASHLEAALEKLENAVQNEAVESAKEHLEQGTFSDASDKYFSLLYGDGTFLADHFDDPILCFMQAGQCINRLQHYTEDYDKRFAEYLERGEVIAEQHGRIFEFEAVLRAIRKQTVLLNEPLLRRVDAFPPEQILRFSNREMNKYYGKLDQVAQDINKWKLKGYKVLVAFSDAERMERFKKAMDDFEVTVNTESEFERVSSGQAILCKYPIQQGFYFDTFKAVLLTENELYGEGRKTSKKRQPTKSSGIRAFSELSIGDYVVHESHGVGQYVGVEQVKVDATRKDFFKIRYAQDDYLYIPVESAGTIQKYMGTDKERVKLNRLGGTEWKKTKSRARKAIEDMTDELLELYAQRQAQRGFAFSADNEWQREFESMFPYRETPDQLKCIAEIKDDMERAQPMERLLCGDVGYGKTEVALRAAFKAVLNSKQVAILVPTTILAQQHYNNILERFSKYPANIQMLSRFKSKAEQEKIIEDVRTGVVDVIVGTHRLLSKDIQFKNLGLLVIDEEQRFGVKHKEKIKQMKQNIDVLTLTATPIPRTLHMSMIGIRDMSVIEDPPEDRYPVQTYVVENDAHLVREAIVREIERGGQVYFVHNRVEDIDQVAAKLQALVPEANIRFAHGQMNEHMLERVMLDFMDNAFNVLVSTTIIETGLDIPNVNTIIINDGDRFGLSQLYQLRGRVGRSNRVAYCYIFYQENKVLSEVAQKRLRAIKEFTELGAGFKIAMRDLEIRGAGNVLGTAQHGHMEAIGYDLYCKMLEESIQKKRGDVVKERIQAKIDLAVNAFIPEQYIGNSQIKIEIYKKIASVDSREAYHAIYEEIEDRFGTLPISVGNLLSIAFIKALCEEMGIEEVSEEDGAGSAFVLRFAPDAPISPLFISKVLEFDSKNVRFFAGNPANLRYKITNRLRKREEQLIMLEKFIEKIYSFHSDYVNI